MDARPLGRRMGTVAIALLTALGPGCVKRLERTLHDDISSVDRSAPFLKAHLKDGRVYLFSTWSVDEGAKIVVGHARVLDVDRHQLSDGEVALSLGDVAVFETNVVQTSPSVAILAVVTGVSLVVTAACIADPKACFGSCPTFYVSDGRRQ